MRKASMSWSISCYDRDVRATANAAASEIAIIKPGAAHLPGRKKAKILVPRTRWYASCQEQTRTRSLLQLSCLPGLFDSEIKTTVCCWRIFFSVKHRRMCLFAYSGWRLKIGRVHV